MKTPVVRIPASLLLDRYLTPTAKVLWMVLQSSTHRHDEPNSPARLEARSGLSRHTVLRGVAQLESAGWLPALPTGELSVPDDLVLDTRVEVRAKLIYAALQMTSGHQTTYAELSALTGVCPTTVKKAVTALQNSGWVKTAQTSKFNPIHFTLLNPAADRREQEKARAEHRLDKAKFKGEAIMREYLSLIVDIDEYEDDASPGFLVNPFTGEELQFDRYYPPSVAFEFNGTQHYIPTEFADLAHVRKQQGRDLLKRAISKDRGITLVVVHTEDLTLEGIRRKVEGLLPMRLLDGQEPLIAYLKKVSQGYRRNSRRRAASSPS